MEGFAVSVPSKGFKVETLVELKRLGFCQVCFPPAQLTEVLGFLQRFLQGVPSKGDYKCCYKCLVRFKMKINDVMLTMKNPTEQE